MSSRAQRRRRPLPPPEGSGILRRLRWPLLALVLVYTYAVGGYMLLGFGFVDALYMASLALTTAGFNPVDDLQNYPGAKVFTVSVAVFGVSLFLVLLAIVTSALTEGRIANRGRRKKMQDDIGGLIDHYIICAYGRVGRAAAQELAEEKVAYVVVDAKEEIEEQLQRDGVLYILGDPSSEPVLRRAGIERARGIVCAVDDDSANVYIALVARSLNPDIYVVARASSPQTPAVLYKAGANRVISPYESSGKHMGRLVLRRRLVDYLEMPGDGDSALRFEELLIEESSPLIGQTLEEAAGRAIPVLLRRVAGELLRNPPPSTRLARGDLLLVVGDPEALRRLEET